MSDKETLNTPAIPEGGDVAADLMNNPEVLASLQELSLDSKNRALSQYRSLPSSVKRRVKALKKLQLDTLKMESDFYKELNLLEIKYASKYQPFFERRRDVLNGDVEPNDDDCDFPSDDEEVGDLTNDLKQKVKIDGEGETPAIENKTEEPVTSGIADFWLTIFRNVQLLNEMVEEHDVPILKHLRDIRCMFNSDDQPGFTLEFHFAANEFFTDTVLTKQYFVKFDPMTDDPFSYEGPEIVRGKGCDIHWKHNKNVTVKLIKKVQKHKGRGEKRTVTKTVKTDSFFNFFDPPKESLDNPEVEIEPEIEQLLQSDFEIGQFLRERVIPRAVLYFTGDALEEEDEFDEEEEEEEGEEEYDEHDDADFNPTSGGGRGRGRGNANQQTPECKQQ